MSDIDGACSSSLIIILLRSLGVVNYTLFFHSGKQHGSHDKMDEILNSNIELLIIPDASSNDIDDCRILKSNRIDIIILDHHLMQKPNPYAIVINPYLSNTLNHSLSGAGVTYKFCEAYFSRYKTCEWAEYGTEDIVAVSIVADDCDLTSLENRAFVCQGLENGTNDFLSYMFEKKCTKGKTPAGISWNIAPLGNAVARMDEQESKLLFLKALVGDIDYKDAVKEMLRVKRKQDEAVKNVLEELEDEIDYNQKALIGFSDASNKSYLGLAANKICGKYSKPTFLLRELNSTMWTGSLRSPINIAEQINESGLAEAQGHEKAAGIVVKKANLERFKQWLDALNLSTDPDTEVAAKVSPKDITLDLCQQIQDNNALWGKGLESPTFYIKTKVTKDNISIFKKKTNTIKVQVDGLSCLMFFAKEEDIKEFSKYGSFEIEMIVGDCGVNEWNGEVSPQCSIIKYEICGIQEKQESWEDLF